MGEYAKMLAESLRDLEKAQADYDNAIVKLADSPRTLRERVVGDFRQELEEAKETVRYFSDLDGA